VSENGDFQPLHPKISRNSQTISNAATVTVNWKFAVDFFARGLHTRTAVPRLPLRQLGFLVIDDMKNETVFHVSSDYISGLKYIPRHFYRTMHVVQNAVLLS